MKKSHLIGAVCALFLCVSVSTHAGLVQGGSELNGNNFADLGSSSNVTSLEVIYFSMLPVSLQIFAPEPLDHLQLTIYNQTGGIPWTDFHFILSDATAVESSFHTEPMSGSISGITSSPEMLTLYFSPPELFGLLNTTATVEVGSGGGEYWLDMHPTTVPMPAAVWLFGPGLLGLIAIAGRKKAA